MNYSVSLSKGVMENLCKHARDFEKNHPAVLEDNALVPAPERKKYQTLFKQYCQQLQNLINNAKTNDSDDNSIPFVTIGSVVELENLQNNRITKIMVTFPFSDLPKPAKTIQASYNSPMGQACFLKKPDEIVEVNAPGGVFKYRIKSIALALP